METRLRGRALPPEASGVADCACHNQAEEVRVGSADAREGRSGNDPSTYLAAGVPPRKTSHFSLPSALPLTPHNMATAEGLHRTILKCRFHHLKYLFDLGTKLNLKNEEGEGVLMTALKVTNDRLREKMFYFLIRRGARCDEVDSTTGRDAFLWTCYLGMDTQVKQLLKHSLGDVNFHQKDHSGNTGLHYLVKAGKLELVSAIARCMKRFAISVDIPDLEGVTPFIHAKRLGLTEIEEVLVAEGNACPTQFDFDTLHLVGSSISNTQRSSPKQRRVASAFCPGTRYISPNYHNDYNRKRCFSSVSRASSSFGRELNGRKVAHSDGDNTSSSGSSAPSRMSPAWALTGASKTQKVITGQGPPRSIISTSSKTCWTPQSIGSTTWEDVSCQDRGKAVTRSPATMVYSSQPSRTASAAPSSSRFINQKTLTTTKTSGQTLSGNIDVTRALSPHNVDFSHGDSSHNKSTAETLHPASRDVRGVQTLFQYMSMQLTPTFRPKADAKNAYKPPPKPKPKPKATGGWGVISFMSKLKARSQKMKMQSLAKGGGGAAGGKLPLFNK